MAHALVFDHETAQDAVFVCSVCGEVIWFNKNPDSDPHALLVDGVWSHPADPDKWMSPCTQ